MKTDKLKNRLLEFYLLGKKHSDAGDTFESTEYLNDDIIKYLIEKEELNY